MTSLRIAFASSCLVVLGAGCTPGPVDLRSFGSNLVLLDSSDDVGLTLTLFPSHDGGPNCPPLDANVVAEVDGVSFTIDDLGGAGESDGSSYCSTADFSLSANAWRSLPPIDVSTVTIADSSHTITMGVTRLTTPRVVTFGPIAGDVKPGDAMSATWSPAADAELDPGVSFRPHSGQLSTSPTNVTATNSVLEWTVPNLPDGVYDMSAYAYEHPVASCDGVKTCDAQIPGAATVTITIAQ